ncbi:hypothetical protein RhiirA5_438725 [Rhizophagus irregularis]|uniref:Uncharacterized protein n=1 Tax=Rhizophagus irregularis TaxID=588596 RepID=A0A2N0NIQ4_9GLOM|nr:hypothetical protein RhiirA5_438725 [Rhizophagus irregularis]PKC68655.1 hypothetical protein RhiirA1_456948 [Rhizophagus irregularis]
MTLEWFLVFSTFPSQELNFWLIILRYLRNFRSMKRIERTSGCNDKEVMATILTLLSRDFNQ